MNFLLLKTCLWFFFLFQNLGGTTFSFYTNRLKSWKNKYFLQCIACNLIFCNISIWKLDESNRTCCQLLQFHSFSVFEVSVHACAYSITVFIKSEYDLWISLVYHCHKWSHTTHILKPTLHFEEGWCGFLHIAIRNIQSLLLKIWLQVSKNLEV